MSDLNLQPLPDYGEHFTVEEFKKHVVWGAVTPDDGNGYWATASGVSTLSVWSSKKPDWASHVMWYNR